MIRENPQIFTFFKASLNPGAHETKKLSCVTTRKLFYFAHDALPRIATASYVRYAIEVSWYSWSCV